jgi:hypothetical protein
MDSDSSFVSEGERSWQATLALSPVKSDNGVLNALSIVPGVVLLAAIGYAATILKRSFNGYAKAHHSMRIAFRNRSDNGFDTQD